MSPGTMLKGGLIGGTIAFLWGMFSWMVLPWHMSTLTSIPDPSVVTESLKNNFLEHGVYLVPDATRVGGTPEEKQALEEEMQRKFDTGPVGFLVVRPSGAKHFSMTLAMGFLINVFAGLILTALLGYWSALSWIQTLALAGLLGLFAAVFGHLPNWNWWGFPAGYTLVYIVDTVVTTILMGLGIRRFVKFDSKVAA